MAPRHSMWRVVSAPLVKRLDRLGYEIVPKGALSGNVAGKESAVAPIEVDGDKVLTQDMLDQALAIAEGVAYKFETRLKDEDEEAIVEALGRYFVLGEVPEGMAIEPTAEPEAEPAAPETPENGEPAADGGEAGGETHEGDEPRRGRRPRRKKAAA